MFIHYTLAYIELFLRSFVEIKHCADIAAWVVVSRLSQKSGVPSASLDNNTTYACRTASSLIRSISV